MCVYCGQGYLSSSCMLYNHQYRCSEEDTAEGWQVLHLFEETSPRQELLFKAQMRELWKKALR